MYLETLKFTDAMDQIVTGKAHEKVNVETEIEMTPKPRVVVNVETKRCSVKLVSLDSILFDNKSDNCVAASEMK